MLLKARYDKLMQEWEHRLTTRDTNRVVRPFEWGLDWFDSIEGLEAPPRPASNGVEAEQDPSLAEWAAEFNRRMIAASDSVYSYRRPEDFRLEKHRIRVYGTGSHSDPEKDDKKYEGQHGVFLRFTSPYRSPYEVNNTVNARWFPAKNSKKAIIVMPQWNSDAISHNAFGKLFNMQGVSMLRMTMPYHDTRMPSELKRADYAVSANIGRTLATVRQAILDIRCCADWLQSQGYEQLGLLGTSLGSCYAFIASAHDERFGVNVFNHASTTFGDVVWTGDSTRHIRAGVEEALTQDSLRAAWMGISPMAYFDKFSRWPKRSLMIYTKYDQTFLPEFSLEIAEKFREHTPDVKVVGLPCGHYTLGETPYKYMDAYNILRFTSSAFAR